MQTCIDEMDGAVEGIVTTFNKYNTIRKIRFLGERDADRNKIS